MDLCIVVKTILMSVPLSQNAPARPTSPIPRHFVIVETDVVFPLPNSRQRHNQRNANTCAINHNIGVFIFLDDERLDQAVDVATIVAYIYGGLHRFVPQHLRCRRVIFIADDSFVSFSLLWVFSYDCIHVGRLVSIFSLIM